MYDSKTSIDDFLNATAAKQPIPGGGSVTALVGALAASLGEMVLNYSVGKKSLQPFVGELKPGLEEMNRARLVFQQLMVEDQAAYEAMTLAKKLPADDPDREAKFNASLLACIRVPEAIAATAVQVVEICDRMINFVNPYLLSDLAVCADLSMATTRCAVYSVRANMKEVADPADRAAVESTVNHLLTRAVALIQQVAPRVRDRENQNL